MPARGATRQLRITPRSAVLAVAMFGLTLLLLRVAVASQRVLGWMLVAAAIAGLLHPLVARLASRLPRGLAVLLVVGGSVATFGGLGYRLVDSLVAETARLQEAAPAAAERIERDDQIGEVARDVRLAERTEQFLEELPERLRGGTPAEAIRAAATRGVAYLATVVLSIFFLLHGGALAAGAMRQMHEGPTRDRAQRVALAAFNRGFGYARGSLLMSAGAGLVAYVVARAAHVPGPVPLALWVALWDLVPIIGFAVGALPIVVLSGVGHTSRGIAVAGVLLAYQVLEALVIQRRVERRSIRLGPFLTVAGGMAGLELYGIGGALVAVMVLALAVAGLDELASTNQPAPAAGDGAAGGD
ncbi:MAG TPA: AI-2E family transporter [Acidimicrobiales bacterium]|nr:AI-2E family transporter [Acidimicrobiales bacterium]